MNSQMHNGHSTNPNPKPPRTASLAHKLELLDSNINRVSHQHETLLQLISDQERIGRFRASVEAIGMAVGRFQRWKDAGLPVLGEFSYMGKYRWANSDSKYQGQLKQVQAQLHRLRQHLSTLKKHQWSTQKQSSSTLTQTLSTQKQSTFNQLQTLQKNTQKYLTKVKQQISAQQEQRVRDFAGGYLRVEGEMGLEGVQADLGMLVCEIEYERGRRVRGEVQGMGGGIGEGEMGLGKLERALVVRELVQFKTQTYKHLSHSCQLLLKKLQLAISCLKITTKSKHKNLNISQKYNEEQQEFQDWLKRIQSDREGMRMRVRHLGNKIRVLEYKLGIVGGEGEKEEKDGEGEVEVEGLLGCCREKLEMFCKLKLEYVCNMG